MAGAERKPRGAVNTNFPMSNHPSEAITYVTSASLADFTGAGLIIPFLRGQEAAAVMQELSVVLQREGRVPDLLPFYQAALNREFLCSTATETGWALPHAQVKDLAKPCFALGRSLAPIPWPRDKRGVQMVFLLAVPETDVRGYMTLMTGLARLSKNKGLQDTLMRASDSFEVLNVLRQVTLLPKETAL